MKRPGRAPAFGSYPISGLCSLRFLPYEGFLDCCARRLQRSHEVCSLRMVIMVGHSFVAVPYERAEGIGWDRSAHHCVVGMPEGVRSEKAPGYFDLCLSVGSVENVCERSAIEWPVPRSSEEQKIVRLRVVAFSFPPCDYFARPLWQRCDSCLSILRRADLPIFFHGLLDGEPAFRENMPPLERARLAFPDPGGRHCHEQGRILRMIPNLKKSVACLGEQKPQFIQ